MNIFNQIALYTYIIVSILACGATYIYVTVGLGGDTFGGILWALICGVFMGLLFPMIRARKTRYSPKRWTRYSDNM